LFIPFGAALLGLLLGHLHFVRVAINLLSHADGIEVSTLDMIKKFDIVKAMASYG